AGRCRGAGQSRPIQAGARCPGPGCGCRQGARLALAPEAPAAACKASAGKRGGCSWVRKRESGPGPVGAGLPDLRVGKGEAQAVFQPVVVGDGSQRDGAGAEGAGIELPPGRPADFLDRDGVAAALQERLGLYGQPCGAVAATGDLAGEPADVDLARLAQGRAVVAAGQVGARAVG